MRRKLTSLLAICGLGLAGCSSMETATSLHEQSLSDTGETIAHLQGSTWGIYLLSIPLLTGSTDSPGTIAFLQDTVNVHSVVDMVTAKSAQLGGTKTMDLQSASSSFWFFPVIFIRSSSASANALR